MRQTINYSKINDRKERDAAAIQDIKNYLTDDQWDAIMQMVGNPTVTIQNLNFAFGFTGIDGYPFHAFCRKYRLADYRAWMAEPEAGGPILTDEEGFSIKKDSAGLSINDAFDGGLAS